MNYQVQKIDYINSLPIASVIVFDELGVPHIEFYTGKGLTWSNQSGIPAPFLLSFNLFILTL
jgi:hypothetical protein